MTEWIGVFGGFAVALILFVMGFQSAPTDRSKRLAWIEQEKAERRRDMHDAMLSAQQEAARAETFGRRAT